jgi:hypothetical protein
MPRYLLTGGLIVVVLGGCGGDGKIAPVSGVVTLNGQPVADIAVSFQPIAGEGSNSPGPAAFGVTGPDGRYTAKIMGEETRGASVGKNQVRFSAHAVPSDTSDEGLNKMKSTVKIPARYWSESQLELDVPAGGTTSADFELKSP